MLSEPMTLYKLMNLYMLKQVNFPLTYAQISDFFLSREYTDYFTLQQALTELLEAGLARKETSHNSTRYEITREGEETLSFFGKNISPAIIEDMDQYLKENRLRLRNEVGTGVRFLQSYQPGLHRPLRGARGKDPAHQAGYLRSRQGAGRGHVQPLA